MGDALWWTLQTATTSTFGPNVSSSEGRILGSIIMFVGIGITGAYIDRVYPCFRVDSIQSVFDTRKRPDNNLGDEIGEG
jgi:voltage-gated potassium channel